VSFINLGTSSGQTYPFAHDRRRWGRWRQEADQSCASSLCGSWSWYDRAGSGSGSLLDHPDLFPTSGAQDNALDQKLLKSPVCRTASLCCNTAWYRAWWSRWHGKGAGMRGAFW